MTAAQAEAVPAPLRGAFARLLDLERRAQVWTAVRAAIGRDLKPAAALDGADQDLALDLVEATIAAAEAAQP